MTLRRTILCAAAKTSVKNRRKAGAAPPGRDRGTRRCLADLNRQAGGTHVRGLFEVPNPDGRTWGGGVQAARVRDLLAYVETGWLNPRPGRDNSGHNQSGNRYRDKSRHYSFLAFGTRRARRPSLRPIWACGQRITPQLMSQLREAFASTPNNEPARERHAGSPVLE